MRSLTWVDQAGTATVLDGSAGILARANPVGLEAANPSNVIDDLVNFDGGVLVNRRRPVRQIALPLYFEHATRVETVLGQAATMLQGPGTLTWTDDVNVRTLKQVIYETGLDGAGETTLLEATRVVSLLALDPFWYGAAGSAILPTDAVTAFNAAISFNSVTAFNGGGTLAVTVPGDVEAYPVVTVTGPVDTLTVGSGGAAWELASPLSPSDTLIVDHRPGSRGPRKNGGLVSWVLLTEASRLWPLDKGITTVIVGATGATAETTIVLAFESRYLTP